MECRQGQWARWGFVGANARWIALRSSIAFDALSEAAKAKGTTCFFVGHEACHAWLVEGRVMCMHVRLLEVLPQFGCYRFEYHTPSGT